MVYYLKMQKLDRATLFELQWRDWLLWPLARPAGFIYEYIGHPLIEAVSHTFLISTKPFGLPRFIRRPLKPRFLRKEIFTLANLVTLYGLFLFGELLYLMWAVLWERREAPIYSLTTYFLDIRKPDLWAVSWVTFEIFVTDLVDGPLARLNRAVTALGTLLDHTRDYLTGFAALFFLIVISIISADWIVVVLEIIIYSGFAAIMRYHGKFMRRARNAAGLTREPKFISRILQEFKFLRAYALEEYQSRLIGRVQFGALAVAIGLGLFSYAAAFLSLRLLFLTALIVSILSTFYYIYDLRRGYQEKGRIFI